MREGLNLFFKPRTIAIIGASLNKDKVGGILVDKSKSFKGEVVLVNPNYSEIDGDKVYSRVFYYPAGIDLAIVAIPKKFVMGAMRDIVRAKIKNVIIISAGYSEIGDLKAEKKIIDFARKNEINVLGPNCFGIVNSHIKLDLTFSAKSVDYGDVVFLSQSGALGSYVMDLNIPLRGFVSLGNMSDLSFSDWIEFFSRDNKTKKIVLYVEKLKDGRRFIDVCKRSSKEIVVVKSGRTKKGVEATVSHTGSLATSFDIYKGAFRQAGVKYKENLAEAFEIKRSSIVDKLNGEHVGIITNAGGAGALISDELSSRGIKVYGPKDILGTAMAKDYFRALDKIKNPYTDIVVVFTPQSMSDPIGVARAIISSRWKDKILAVFLGKKSVGKASLILKEAGVKVINRI